MGRLLLAAALAAIGFGGPIFAKPDQDGRGKNTPARAVGGPEFSCPPGLRKKGPNCLSPGHEKKLFEVGQRVPKGYIGLHSYKALPYELRMRYGGTLDPQASYIYDKNYIYRVDPGTMVVRQILRSLI